MGAGRAGALPALCLAAVLLSGCGAADDDPGPGAVTVGEERALDQAAEMLDEQRLRAPPPPSAAPTAAETPAAR